MNCNEFSDRFVTLLNMHTNQPIFGEEASIFDVTVDEYEKSLFLTRAEKKIALDLYTGMNIQGISFEEKEQVRESLDALVCTKEYTANDKVAESESFKHVYAGDKQVAAFPLPGDLMSVIFEEVKFSSYISGCKAEKTAVVVPATHDDIWHRLQNPFRGPSRDRVLRLNIANNLVELISDHPVGSYILRYLREPQPIILTDLPDGLTIDGKSSKTECELPPMLHEAILELAVKLALQSKMIGRVEPKKEKQQD